MPQQKLKTSSQKTSHHHHDHCSGKSFKEIAHEAFKKVNFKITKPRLAVIHCLENAEKPLSPKNMYEQIRQSNDSKIDQVSVYRVLELLVTLGLVHQIYPSGNYISCHTSCEKKPSHILANCLKCSKTLEIQLDGNFIDSIFNEIKKNSAFTPMEHLMQIDGVCCECRAF